MDNESSLLFLKLSLMYMINMLLEQRRNDLNVLFFDVNNFENDLVKKKKKRNVEKYIQIFIKGMNILVVCMHFTTPPLNLGYGDVFQS